jgi:hypothetical protein
MGMMGRVEALDFFTGYNDGDDGKDGGLWFFTGCKDEDYNCVVMHPENQGPPSFPSSPSLHPVKKSSVSIFVSCKKS